MFKLFITPLLLFLLLQMSSTLLASIAVYFILYPSFFGIAYPNNTVLNLLWLFLSTPLIFESFFAYLTLKSYNEDYVSLFKQRIGFDLLVKGSYLIALIALAPDISLLQVRLYYLFLVAIVLDSLKFYLLSFSFKGRIS